MPSPDASSGGMTGFREGAAVTDGVKSVLLEALLELL